MPMSIFDIILHQTDIFLILSITNNNIIIFAFPTNLTEMEILFEKSRKKIAEISTDYIRNIP